MRHIADVRWLATKNIYPGSQRLLIKHIIVRSLFWMIDILKNMVFGEKTYLKDLLPDSFQISTFKL